MKRAVNAAVKGACFRLSARLFPRKVRLALKRPLISFTFDDVPMVTYRNGLPILEKHKCRGTFYLAGGLSEKGPGYFDRHAVCDLIRRGHEIGCHTYRHLKTASCLPGTLRRDIERNRHYMNEKFSGYSPLNFAYPYGSIGPWNKPLLAGYFHSLRSTYSGIHSGVADLNTLRANRLYSERMSFREIDALMEQVSRVCGWLIFYTHDVSRTPSSCGCHPELLQYALEMGTRTGAALVTVREALEVIRHNVSV